MSTPVAQSLPVNRTACEQVLGITELAQEIIALLHDDPDSLRSLALTTKQQSENALRQLWSKKRGLKDFFQFLPSATSTETNPENNHKTVVGDSDSFERLKIYTGYVREFTRDKEDDSQEEHSFVARLFEAISSQATLFPDLRTLRWTSNSSASRDIFSRFMGQSVVDVQILKCPLKDVGEYINIIKQRAPGLQRLKMHMGPFARRPQSRRRPTEPQPQVVSEDDILFPHLRILYWTSIPSDCQRIFRRLVAPSMMDLRLRCLSEDAKEYVKLISQRAPGLQRLEMEVYNDNYIAELKHYGELKRLRELKPKATLQDQVLFPDLRVLRWDSQSPDPQEIFRQLLGQSVLDLRILIPMHEDGKEYARIIRQRARGLQRLEIDFDTGWLKLPMELDGMDIKEFKTNCTLSEDAFFSLATMTHLTSLKLAVPREGYKEIPGTLCFPALRSLSLCMEGLGERCRALVHMVSSGSLEKVFVDILNLYDFTTDMLESFFRELVNYPLREFTLAGTGSIRRDDRLDIAEATLHALQPLLQHRTMTLLHIDVSNLMITPDLLSALATAYPALETLSLITDPSHWPALDVLFILANSFPSLKKADISVTNPSNLLTLPRDWQSPSNLSMLHIHASNDSWGSEEDRGHLKALFPHADITIA